MERVEAQDVPIRIDEIEIVQDAVDVFRYPYVYASGDQPVMFLGHAFDTEAGHHLGSGPRRGFLAEL